MPNMIHVTGDDDSFLNQLAEVDEAMEGIQKALAPNDIMVCVECEGPIEPERKSVLPSAVTCIECAKYLAEEEARKGKLTAKQPSPGRGWSSGYGDPW